MPDLLFVVKRFAVTECAKSLRNKLLETVCFAPAFNKDRMIRYGWHSVTPTLKRTEKEKNDWKCKTSRGERLKVNMAFCGVLIAVCRTCIPMLVLLAQWEDAFHVIYLRAIRVFTTLKTLKSNQWIFYHHECSDTIVCELVKCHERNSSLTGGFESQF